LRKRTQQTVQMQRVRRLAGEYRWWLTVLFATTLFLFASYDFSILPEQISNKCRQLSGQNQNNCPGYIVAGDMLNAVAILLKPYSEVLTAVSGVAVAAFTFTLWLTTREMWRASTNQLRHAEVTAERQLRAYLYAANADLFFDGETICGHVKVRNAGQTPAYQVSPYFQMGTRPASDRFIEPDRDDTGRSSSMIIGPGGAGDANQKLHIGDRQAELLARVQSGDLVVYGWGRVDYFDVFKKPRWMTFRMRGAQTPRGQWVFEATDDGNDAN
jgi:hypothetical protein